MWTKTSENRPATGVWVLGYWVDSEWTAVCCPISGETWGNGITETRAPSHWMPLPDPPKDA